MKLKLSLHPRLASVIDLIFNISFIIGLEYTPFWWALLIFFLVRQLFWLVMIKFVYYPVDNIKWRHYLSLCIFSLGFILIFIFIEQNTVRYLISAMYIILIFISFWYLPRSKVELAVFFKPHSRWRFIMTIMGLSGIFVGTQAIISFKILTNIHNSVWLVSSAILAVIIAAWWWWEYNLKINGRFWLSVLVYLLIFIEFAYIVYKLPLGHLVNGLLMIWVWYLLWLITRFNLSSMGIKWTKQLKFLSINVLLILLYLIFIVKWK